MPLIFQYTTSLLLTKKQDKNIIMTLEPVLQYKKFKRILHKVGTERKKENKVATLSYNNKACNKIQRHSD